MTIALSRQTGHNRAEVLKVSIFEYDKEKEEKGRLSEDQIKSIRRETHPEKQIQKDSSGFRRIK